MSALRGLSAPLVSGIQEVRTRLHRRLLRIWQKGMGLGLADTAQTQWMWRWICLLNLGHDLDGYLFERHLHCVFCGKRVLNPDHRPVRELSTPGGDQGTSS